MLIDTILNITQQKNLQKPTEYTEDEPNVIEQCYLVTENLPLLEALRI